MSKKNTFEKIEIIFIFLTENYKCAQDVAIFIFLTEKRINLNKM